MNYIATGFFKVCVVHMPLQHTQDPVDASIYMLSNVCTASAPVPVAALSSQEELLHNCFQFAIRNQ